MRVRSLTETALVLIGMAASCAFSRPASAASVVVANWNLPSEVTVTGTHFDVDEKTGTARLGVDLFDSSFETSIYSESVAVPGLVFDRERREVRYEHGGSTETCAVRKKVLWATTYPETGQCRVTVTTEARNADGGSGMQAGWLVELATSEAARAAR